MTPVWYSAMLEFVRTVDADPVRRPRSVVLFLAEDFDHAWRRAIELGREAQEDYANASGQHVALRLNAVQTLDELGAEITDGREVYAEPGEERTRAEHPEASRLARRPTQSGV